MCKLEATGSSISSNFVISSLSVIIEGSREKAFGNNPIVFSSADRQSIPKKKGEFEVPSGD
jgi:hypothetical protein